MREKRSEIEHSRTTWNDFELRDWVDWLIYQQKLVNQIMKSNRKNVTLYVRIAMIRTSSVNNPLRCHHNTWYSIIIISSTLTFQHVNTNTFRHTYRMLLLKSLTPFFLHSLTYFLTTYYFFTFHLAYFLLLTYLPSFTHVLSSTLAYFLSLFLSLFVHLSFGIHVFSLLKS